MIMNAIWKTWEELKSICQNKKIIFFARSEDWLKRSKDRLSGYHLGYIVDNDTEYTDTLYHGMKVQLPTELYQEDLENIYVIIVSGAYASIAAELEANGLQSGTHFCCTPEYRDWGLLEEMKTHDRNVLVTCSDRNEPGRKRASKLGGGLYKLNTCTHELTKLISGAFRQITVVDSLMYIVEYVEGAVYVVNFDYQVIGKFSIGAGNACGIDYYPKQNQLFVAFSQLDLIKIYDRDSFKQVGEIAFSHKREKDGIGHHHINDVCIIDNSLFVSYFSRSGNYKIGIDDGGMDEYSLDNMALGRTSVISGLSKPHSVKFINNRICLLDSMTGEFREELHRVSGKFPGFMRGLEFDGKYFYIGQSETMYSSRLFGVSNNIMCNAGLYLFDNKTKVSRFYSFPDMMNVHDILVLDSSQ